MVSPKKALGQLFDRLGLGACAPGIAVALVVAALLASYPRISPAALPGVGVS